MLSQDVLSQTPITALLKVNARPSQPQVNEVIEHA